MPLNLSEDQLDKLREALNPLKGREEEPQADGKEKGNALDDLRTQLTEAITGHKVGDEKGEPAKDADGKAPRDWNENERAALVELGFPRDIQPPRETFPPGLRDAVAAVAQFDMDNRAHELSAAAPVATQNGTTEKTPEQLAQEKAAEEQKAKEQDEFAKNMLGGLAAAFGLKSFDGGDMFASVVGNLSDRGASRASTANLAGSLVPSSGIVADGFAKAVGGMDLA